MVQVLTFLSVVVLLATPIFLSGPTAQPIAQPLRVCESKPKTVNDAKFVVVAEAEQSFLTSTTFLTFVDLVVGRATSAFIQPVPSRQEWSHLPDTGKPNCGA